MFKPLLSAAVIALGCIAQTVGAQGSQAGFPSKPIKVVVPFTPGAFNDTLGRTLAQEFGKGFAPGSQVDNKPGGGTVIGTDFTAKSAPDGHTILIVAFPFALINSLHIQSKIDVTRDFAPLVWAGSTPNLLVVPPSSPYKSVQGILAAAKAKPGSISYASTGNGTSNHLSMELFKVMSGTDLTHIPYKGSAPAVTDLIGGQVQAMFDNVPNVIQHVKAGRLRALGITTPKRVASMPDIPTIDEAGVPGYQVNVWFGVVAPAGTPKDTVTKLNAEINRILGLAEVKERFNTAGIDIVGGTPETFDKHIREQVTTWGKVVKDANIRAD